MPQCQQPLQTQSPRWLTQKDQVSAFPTTHTLLADLLLCQHAKEGLLQAT